VFLRIQSEEDVDHAMPIIRQAYLLATALPPQAAG